VNALTTLKSDLPNEVVSMLGAIVDLTGALIGADSPKALAVEFYEDEELGSCCGVYVTSLCGCRHGIIRHLDSGVLHHERVSPCRAHTPVVVDDSPATVVVPF
jgi:hypothetical protein